MAFMDSLNWIPPTAFFNDPPLFKEMPKELDLRDPDNLDICSAVVVRLGSKESPLGLFVVGWRSFYNFGPYPGALGLHAVKPFLLLIKGIEASLRKNLTNG